MTALDRVIFFSKEDLAGRPMLEKAEKLLEKKHDFGQFNLNALLEFHHIHQYFENNKYLDSWTSAQRAAYAAVLKNAMAATRNYMRNMIPAKVMEEATLSLNIKKAVEIDELMQEHGISTIEDLRKQLSRLKEIGSEVPPSNEAPEKVNLTQEIMASLGITSQAEFEEAFKDPWIQSRFYHTSNPTSSSYAYAQRLIERAKANIKAFLRAHPNYDCTDMEETATTVLGGILKKGVPIDIVTRPSDNGAVIFYYSSEKDTLDTDSVELWVDNGLTDPHILTLGRILKSTGINRIPINMN